MQTDDMQKKTIAITGASGFIGGAILPQLVEAGFEVIAITRSSAKPTDSEAISWRTIEDVNDPSAWRVAIGGADILIHLAGNPQRTTYKNDASSQKLAANMEAAIIKAMQHCEITKAVIVSTIYARLSLQGITNAYGASKCALEQQFQNAQDIQTLVLRLPPVYGPNSKGGISTLVSLVKKQLPLPLASANQPRSYLSVGNLSDLFILLMNISPEQWQKANGRCYEPYDGTTIGTAQLARTIAKAAGCKIRLFGLPLVALRLLGKLSGKSEQVSGAIDGLEVLQTPSLLDDFGWQPVERMPESLAFLNE